MTAGSPNDFPRVVADALEERIARLNAMATDKGQAPKPGPWG